jgi:transcription elongation factor GreA
MSDGQEQVPDTKHEAARLRKIISKQHWDDLDAAWTEAVETESIKVEDLLSVLAKVQREAAPDRAESLLWFLLTTRAEMKGAPDTLAVARSAVEQFPTSDMLRDELRTLYPKAHAEIAETGTLAELIFGDKALALPDAVARMEKLLAFRPDSYVIDPAMEPPGQVTGFDLDTNKLAVMFEENRKTYDLPGVDALEPLAPDDFRALSVFDPPQLESMAMDDPIGLVTSLLRAFGPRMTFQTMKRRVQNILTDTTWNKWWADAKGKLRRAPWVDMSPGASPKFQLRKTPIPYDAILKAQFNTATTPEEKLVAVLEYLKEIDQGAEPHADTLTFFGNQLHAAVESWKAAELVTAIGALAVVAEIHKRLPDAVAAPEHELEPLLPEGPALEELMRPIQNDILARLVLSLIKDEIPDRWVSIYQTVMPAGSQAECAAAAEALAAGGHDDELRAATDQIMRRPDRNAAGLAWLWRTVTGNNCPAALAELDKVGVALAVFSSAAALGRGKAKNDPVLQRLIPQIRSAVSARNFEPMRVVLADADEGRARMVKDYIDRVSCLSDNNISRVHEIILHTHRKLFVEKRNPWQEDAIYTTEAGLEKANQALSHLVTVKMAEASLAVGAAAALGDLSENAEWTAAKEERDRIATRATMMQEEIKKAKIVTPEMAAADHVTIGSEVKARNLATDQIERMIFLGPWDADHDNDIYSYRAMLGQAFMGRKVGDPAELASAGEQKTWEIVEISPGL